MPTLRVKRDDGSWAVIPAIGGSVAVDPTLSVPGMAADAEATGAAIGKLSGKIESDEYQEDIVQQVIAALGTPVFGTVDADNNIILTGKLADGVYTLKYEVSEGETVEIGNLKIGGASYNNLVPTARAHTDLSTVFNGTGYMDGAYASSSSPYYGSDAATVCTGVIPVNLDSVVYIKGITLDGSNNHNRIGFARDNAKGEIGAHHVKSVTDQGGMATLETLGNQYYKLTINESYFSENFPTLEYIWISGVGKGADLIVTVDEPIE